jgi:hypothetical protein
MKFHEKAEFSFTIPSKYDRVMKGLRTEGRFSYVRSEGGSYKVDVGQVDDLILDLGSEVRAKREPRKGSGTDLSFLDPSILAVLDGSLIRIAPSIVEDLPQIASLVESMPELFLGAFEIAGNVPEVMEGLVHIALGLLEALSDV